MPRSHAVFVAMLAAGLALAGCGGGSDSRTTRGADAPISRLVGIGGGRSIFLECRGSGSPTVVLISGARGGVDDWTHVVHGTQAPVESAQAVFPRLARSTRVCAYDRPGTTSFSGAATRSTPVRQPTSARDGVRDLHAVLTAAHVPGPYVLAAHSLGGTIAVLYAREHPEDVSGLVLVDPGSEFLRTSLTPRQWRRFARAAKAVGTPRTLEAADYARSLAALRAAPPAPPIPATVLTADTPFDFGAGSHGTWRAWLHAQRRLAAVLGARHVTRTHSGHYIAGTQPALVVAEIRRVIRAARLGGRAPTAGRSIAWRPCGKRLQCARVRVPLDWSRPGGRQIELAVARHLAGGPGKRIGTLIASPGGPGESGFDLVRNAGAGLDAIGRGRFDVVGWDPRGTNASTSVRCFRSRTSLARFWAGATIPATTRQSERFRRRTAELARRCAGVSGALLRHVSTADTARDLDHLRRLLGERQVSFLGLSYGTLIGQTYANLFPQRVRAMVLDGVVDAPSWVRGAEARLENVVSPSDAVFERFASLCQAAGPARCAVAGRGPVQAGFQRLLARLRRGPIPAPRASPPGELTYTDLLLSLFNPVRDPAVWPQLGADLDAAEGGDGSALETAARRMRAPAAWSGATTSAAIQCADGSARRSSRAWPAVIGRLEHASHLQGLVQGWWEWAPCASWPARAPGRYAGPWHAKTSTPILLIGTRFDPNTAYANARRAARRLGHAVLLTHDGYGHLSTTDPSACVERAESDYLVGLAVPRRGTVCPSDRQPFDPKFGQPLP